jgi:5-hydroxyisourate hydrolase-like protein (transthyretin family)
MEGAAMADTVNLGPVYWNSANERWADMAFNPFADAQRTAYDYANGTVTIVYGSSAHTFTGTLTARGLKPNFAYQIKINGKPRYYWGDQGDDWANEQLGYAGRWWVSRIVHATGANIGGWNSTDAEYEQWKALGFTDGTYDYVFEGYLLFDYFVTDAEGNATLSFALASSFHVLWKVSQRTPGPNDSAPTAHTVVASSTSPWYSESYPTTDVALYAEWQPGRPLPGQVVPLPGLYNVRLFLTEESFHETAPHRGPWATVMAHDAITFLVRSDNRPPVAVDDAASTPYRIPVTIPVLANDTDPDGDPLTVVAVGRPKHGKVAINAGKTLTYTPNADFSGKDAVTYAVSDGHGGTAKATVRVTVNRAVRCSIAGRITDQATGAPIHEITVRLWRQNGTQWTTVAEKATNRQGAYSFDRWMFGIYVVVPRSSRWVTTPATQAVVIDSVAQREARSFTATHR